MNTRETEAFSVSQLANIIKEVFSHPSFSSLRVYGEVYSIKLGKFSYINLGDQGHKESNSPILKCAFSNYYGNDLGLEEIKVGDVIEISGSLSYYAHGSSLTFWGKEVKVLQSQLGKALLAKKKTLEKLDKLGYLDPKQKKPIPKYCKKVAILTAATGAAYQDILKTLHERFPCDTVLFPTVVQGEEAAKSIVKQLKRAFLGDFDVILLGRGGGSKTDLACFDDELVALTIASSPIPIITCIGHTIDTAIADRVSDAQAITPTEGASLINPSLADTRLEIQASKDIYNKEYFNLLQNEVLSLNQLTKRLEAYSPKNTLKKEKQSLRTLQNTFSKLYLSKVQQNLYTCSELKDDFKNKMKHRLELHSSQLEQAKAILEGNNPDTYAKRGLALVLKDGKKITSIQQLEKGDVIDITYQDGRRKAKID